MGVHWRSMTNPLMGTLQGNAVKVKPGHHQQCTHGIVAAADGIMKETGLQKVMLLSDIHAGCQGRICGYTEFDHLWSRFPELRSDRDAASQLLANRGWLNGDT